MKNLDLIASAIANTFRSKTRTTLTILSIFVGAFTLTLTSGLGTGINSFIADTVSAVGASDVMTVTKPSEDTQRPLSDSSAPVEYDPDRVAAGAPGSSVIALTPSDIRTIEGIEGVETVEPQRSISADFVQFDSGTKFVASASSLASGQTTPLSDGAAPDDDSSALQVALPQSYVEPLGFGSGTEAIGKTVTIGITDGMRAQHLVKATVVGVTEESLASTMGSSLLVNQQLTNALFDAQNTGIPADQADRYSSANVTFASGSTDEQIDTLKQRISDAGFSGTTVADRLGMITTVIDGIVLVLNGFAIIALLAAALGIVNTLFMSVQERTREIGLMKAMGMGSNRVFGLFSLEATFIGFLGSALGAVVAIGAGTVISTVLSDTLLADLPGLHLIAFDPISIGSIILLVMVIAFLAGTIPAARAAKADPVDSLRYE